MTGLTIDRVRGAAVRLAWVAHRTPVLTSRMLDERCDATVLIKAEPFQRGGSFKIRGAYNRMSQLDDRQRAAGVVAYSSGNHGCAVALAARMLGIEALVVVPDNVSPAKLAAIEGYGARTCSYQYGSEDRVAAARAIAAERSMTLIAPFDDYEVMAGQGTIGLELAEQARDLDLVLVPVGGGGLAAGIATAVRGILPRAAVIGVEPEAADDTRQSLRAGRIVTIAPPVTIADGLRTERPGSLTFPVNSRLLEDIVTVTDRHIVDAMRYCFAHLKLVVEPSGAVPLAALLSGTVKASGKRIAVVVSGGNIAPADYATYLVSPGDSGSQPSHSRDFEGVRL